ncbi:MAG: hypothetical protein ABWZ57_15880 [Mesorhizobium sp.]
MSNFTVRESVDVRPDPDLSSQSVGMIKPGDRILVSVQLGDWSKINGTDDTGNVLTGWIASRFVKEIVGQTVQLHPEPLSEQFEEVTGVLDTLVELANWRKVKVTSGNDVRAGWVDTTTLDVNEPQPPPEEVGGGGDRLSLGANEPFRAALLKAEELTGIDASALAALVDAEAAKLAGGPNKGQWDPESFNAGSGAAGLTQFLSRTWLDHARNAATLLNKTAKRKGLVTPLDGIVASRKTELLALRFDPELSIVSAAEYGIQNLRALEDAGLLPDSIGDDEKARYMYLAHHEGANGARAFLRKQNSSDRSKFVKQVGAQLAGALTQRARGDVALAYREWLNDFIDEHIQPMKFRSRNGPSGAVVLDGRPLESFDGAAIPIGQLGGQARLVEKVQQALSKLGYLDPPPDGRWGPVSNWGLERFCGINGLSLGMGFTREIARALIGPTIVLPEIKPRGDWFDKVIAYMNRHAYWICRHAGAVNIVYLEGVDSNGTVNLDQPNVFNDLRMAFTIDDSGTPVVSDWEGTTEPGIFWTMNPMSPRGAARIAFGQYKAWAVGVHLKGKASGHEALVQVAEVTVHRDLNKDFKRLSDRTETGLFGINQHWGYDAPKDDLGNTSAGCLVGRTKKGHREFMAMVKSDPRFLASPSYKFVAAVLPGDEVLGAT